MDKSEQIESPTYLSFATFLATSKDYIAWNTLVSTGTLLSTSSANPIAASPSHGAQTALGEAGRSRPPQTPTQLLQALFVVHKQRTDQLAAAAQGPGRVAVRLHNYAQSVLHMRQLKSKSIGAYGCSEHR